ncbi:MAG: cob(I)yrinic acid a,c-diamide adenosyltransferase [Deltaproteobacteria bacterium]|nr:cob(I)yrinic acid a,c-diamide adenosyltransferase [Deltaproteobacteria bacterium]
MKIYTRTGDRGDTGLFGGARVSKGSARVAAYGDVDELSAAIGLARVAVGAGDIDDALAGAQRELFAVGAELSAQPGKDVGVPLVGPEAVAHLESLMDRAEPELPPLRSFILAGGTEAAARLHLARCICRRAERAVVRLADDPDEDVRNEVVVYLNRLSDTLFVLARLANARAGAADVPWEGRKSARSSDEGA